MDELLKKRIDRAMESLPEDKARQVLDYVEFLQSKYGDRSSRPSTLERLADGVEDTLRVGKVPMAAIKGTRDILTTADRVVKGIAEAGKSVVDGLQEQLREVTSEVASRTEQPSRDAEPTAAPEAGDGEQDAGEREVKDTA